jgi:hypothetical protein
MDSMILLMLLCAGGALDNVRRVTMRGLRPYP